MKTAPKTAPSPVPLKTPVMDAVRGLNAIGWNPELSGGSVSVPLAGLNVAGLNASDACTYLHVLGSSPRGRTANAEHLPVLRQRLGATVFVSVVPEPVRPNQFRATWGV